MKVRQGFQTTDEDFPGFGEAGLHANVKGILRSAFGRLRMTAWAQSAGTLRHIGFPQMNLWAIIGNLF